MAQLPGRKNHYTDDREAMAAAVQTTLTSVIGRTVTAVARAQEPEKACKDETVYVFAGADSVQKKVTVSDWIQNTGKLPVLENVSSLTEIENVKGEETFTAGKKEKLQWKANGNDIYYQGNSKEKVPVKLHITYAL